MAASALRKAMRQVASGAQELLIADRDSLAVDAGQIVTDVGQFRSRLAEAQRATSVAERLTALQSSVEHYAGPFLPGFAHEWVLPQAVELEESYAQAVCSLIGLLAQEGRLQQAVLAGKRAISLCPTREDLHLALVRAYGRFGQTAAAIKQYEELERMLDETWGEEPSPEAQAVLDDLPAMAAVAMPADTLDGQTPTPYRASAAFEGDSAPFFGRESELAEIQGLLDPAPSGPRLLTLIGLGGSGKTRLAKKAAQHLTSAYGGRVWFVSLEGVEESGRMDDTLQTSLAAPGARNTEALETIATAIGTGPGLLVLDNVEQIVPHTKSVAQSLQQSCPGLRILLTSRVPLDATGERLLSVSSLPLPQDYRDLAALRSAPSVQVLVEAAQWARPGFQVTPANAQSVHLLCRKLDGMPLALELAAAKLAMMTPAQVVASIGSRLDLATTRATVRERHRSLQAVIDWSLGLLDEDDRDGFARLSVCRGGFTIDLAVHLLGDRAESLLQRLNRCSLINWSESQEEVRFHMLETVREASCQVLDFGPESVAADAHLRHFDFMRRLMESFEALESEEDRERWTSQVVAESDNVLAAIEAGANGWVPPEDAWSMALPLRRLIERRGRSHVWTQPLCSLLRATQNSLSKRTLTLAHMQLGRCHYGMREIRGMYEHYRLSVEAADASGDARLRIDSRVGFAIPAMLVGRFDAAHEEMRKAIQAAESLGDDLVASNCYAQLGWVFFQGAREAESVDVFRKACSHAKASGDREAIANAQTGYASAIGLESYQESQQLFDHALAFRRAEAFPAKLAHCYYNRALIDYRQGNMDGAVLNLRNAFRTYLESDTALGQTPLTLAGNIMAALGRYREAAACWGRAEVARQRYGMEMVPTYGKDQDREFPKAKAALPNGELEELMERLASTPDEALVAMLFGAAVHSAVAGAAASSLAAQSSGSGP